MTTKNRNEREKLSLGIGLLTGKIFWVCLFVEGGGLGWGCGGVLKQVKKLTKKGPGERSVKQAIRVQI